MKCPLLDKVDALMAQLPEEADKQMLRDMLSVVEHARMHIELGHGTYQMMRAVAKVYAPETLSLERWTK